MSDTIYNTPTIPEPKTAPLGHAFIVAHSNMRRAADALEVASFRLISGRQSQRLRKLANAIRSVPILTLGAELEGRQ